MNNLFNLARGGLSVAQAALRVTGDNMTNGMSGTYSRRSLIIGELGGMSTAQGFLATAHAPVALSVRMTPSLTISCAVHFLNTPLFPGGMSSWRTSTTCWPTSPITSRSQ